VRSPASEKRSHVALFFPSFRGGGAERAMIKLAAGFVDRGLAIELVVASAEGSYLGEVPNAVRLVDLGARRVLVSLPCLIRYLRSERPVLLFSAMWRANLVALWAARLANSGTAVVVSERNSPSQFAADDSKFRGRLILQLMRWFYPQADQILAVSHGVADDLAALTGIERQKIRAIYNPVVTPELMRMAEEPVSHEWFNSSEIPIVLGVGRLSPQKDFQTLVRAFAKVRTERAARLVILGEGNERSALERLGFDLGLQNDVDFPGFVGNPYAYMSKAAVVVVSSRWEGICNVLVEAMAVGTPVVSTDCPSGPAEILEGGHWGKLVPVGDFRAMAKAIKNVLGNNFRMLSDQLKAPLARFSMNNVMDEYISVFRSILSPGKETWRQDKACLHE